MTAIEDAVDQQHCRAAQIETESNQLVETEFKGDNATPVIAQVGEAIPDDECLLPVSDEVSAALDALIASISSTEFTSQGDDSHAKAATELDVPGASEAHSDSASEHVDIENDICVIQQLPIDERPRDHAITEEASSASSLNSDAVFALSESARSATDSSLFGRVDNSEGDALSDDESMDDRDSVASADLLLEAGEVATFASDALQPTTTRRTSRQSSKRQFANASARRIDSERLLADVKKLTASDDETLQV
ncbi:hypothetical protein PINS_up002159 [Pythium insidiosum]|nr:hypothetical protein PINS_up002159 [Pythium insidiosum]